MAVQSPAPSSQSRFRLKLRPKIGECEFCGRKTKLLLSHIVPAFVYRQMKATSGTGYLRMSREPNLRVQDGLKDYILCEACETLFSEWENRFSQIIFSPSLSGERSAFRYGPWLAKFAASLTWRVLTFYRLHPELPHGVFTDWSRTDESNLVWHEFLSDKRPHPGLHELHVLQLDGVVSADGSVPSHLNRYLLNTVDVDLLTNSREILVYAKLLNWMFIGFVEVPNPRQWRGTRIGVGGGGIAPGEFTLPQAIWDLIMQRAENHEEVVDQISDKQTKLIIKAMNSDPERFAKSRTARAIEFDMKLAGRRR